MDWTVPEIGVMYGNFTVSMFKTFDDAKAWCESATKEDFANVEMAFVGKKEHLHLGYGEITEDYRQRCVTFFNR